MFSRQVSLRMRPRRRGIVSAGRLVRLQPTAATRDKAFFESVAGTWKGPGEIVAGKYKGTKFTCNLIGQPSTTAAPASSSTAPAASASSSSR